MEEIVIFGTAGHARVVGDIVRRAGKYQLRAFLGEDVGREIDGYPVLSEHSLSELGITRGIVGVGDNWKRLRVVERVMERFPGFEFVSAIHPSSPVATGVVVKKGSVVMAGAILNSGACIGEHCVINTAASIDHDTQIDDFASVNPGAVLGGNVYVGPFSAIGLGAKVIQGTTIGEHSVIGAGSAVVCDIPDRVVAFGHPCQVKRQREPGPYLLDA